MIQKQQINSVNYAHIFQMLINIDEYNIIIIINSDATEIFILKRLINSKESAIQKNNLYNLIIVNENSLFNENKRMIKE